MEGDEGFICGGHDCGGGEMEKWRNGEMGKWRNREMGYLLGDRNTSGYDMVMNYDMVMILIF